MKTKEIEKNTADQAAQESRLQTYTVEKSLYLRFLFRPIIVTTSAVILISIVIASIYRSIDPSSRIESIDSAFTNSNKKSLETTSTLEDPNVVEIDRRQIQNIRLETVKMQTFYIEKNVTGKITFNEDFMTPVFSPYTGRVIHLAAKLGDEVERGSLLLEIDTPDLVQAESDLITARSSVAKAEATLYLARRNENRLHRLYLNKAAALKDWEQAQSDSKQAESDLRSAKAVLLAARSRLHLFGKSDEEIKKIEKEGKLDRITKVLSPISGTITSRKVGPGQYVRVDNADPIFTIADLSTMWVIADVYESDIPFIELGQPVEVHVAAYPNQVFKARISYIGASADPNTHRVPMRCVVKNDGQKLKAEMFAQLHVLTKSGVKSPAVPIDAIIYDGGRTSVWVERKPNQFIRRDVIIGQVQNGNVQIISGLQPGNKVVSKGSLFLSNALNP